MKEVEQQGEWKSYQYRRIVTQGCLGEEVKKSIVNSHWKICGMKLEVGCQEKQ